MGDVWVCGVSAWAVVSVQVWVRGCARVLECALSRALSRARARCWCVGVAVARA